MYLLFSLLYPLFLEIIITMQIYSLWSEYPLSLVSPSVRLLPIDTSQSHSELWEAKVNSIKLCQTLY